MRRDEKNIVDILEQGLPSATRQQMETARDHVLARLRAERHRGIQTPVQQSDARAGVWWRPAIGVAAAAALIALVVSVAIPLRDHGLYAVLEAADSSMYRISDGNRVPLRVGDRIAALETLRSNGGAGAVLALADGSRVEMGSKSEMSWDRADDGLMVHLSKGSIIVSGAKEGTGRLYVQTKDITASVARTTSLVNVAGDGSSVAVIEGEAHVREGAVEKELHPGQYLSTSPTLAARSLAEAIGWSRNADRHRATLAAFAKGMATTTGTLTPLNEAVEGQTGAAQSVGAAGSAFDVASVKLCDPNTLPASPSGARAGGAGSFQMTRGRVHALCMTVATLVGTAYGFGPLTDLIEARRFDSDTVYRFGNVAARQVRGGPDWIRSDRYTIEAVANDGGDARAMSGRMLRDLLERRFHLTAHVEAEPGSAFALSVAAGGLKIKPVDADSCMPPPTPIDRVRRGEKPVCGQGILTNGPNITVLGGATVFSQLVEMLGEILGVKVIDRTDIPSTAHFTYMLQFAPDERTAGPLGRPGPAAQTSDEPRASDIFTALKEQLGLRLEAVQVPRQYVVIDRIERPSPN